MVSSGKPVEQEPVLGAIERVERRQAAEHARASLLLQTSLFDQVEHRGPTGEKEQRVAEDVDRHVERKQNRRPPLLGPAHEARPKHERERDRRHEGAQRVDARAPAQNEVEPGRHQRGDRREEVDRFDRAHVGHEARQAHVRGVEHRSQRERERRCLPTERGLGARQVAKKSALATA